MPAPRITIIIPVKPGGGVRALERLGAVDYPADRFEVLVAEGCRPSRQRNHAAAAAAGEILYFLDDDSLLDRGNLRRLAGHFADPSVAIVGGPSLTPQEDGLRQQGFGRALGSLFGGGAVRNRYRPSGEVRHTDDRELILCNLGFRTTVFRAMGGFDERLYPNEENELIDRSLSCGHTLLHDPDMPVFRSQRPTLRAFVRQLFTYGRGRGEQTVIGGKIAAATLAPALLLLYLASLFLVHNPVYYLPLVCYEIAVMLFSFQGALAASRPALAPLLLLVYPALHLSYGAGMILGLLSPRFRRRQASSCGVVVKVVKEMAQPLPGASPSQQFSEG